MHVLMLNGSPRPKGNTYRALIEIGTVLEAEGLSFEIVQIGAKPVRDCISCGKCSELGKCIFADDAVNTFAEKAAEADGFVFGTPVYYAHPSGAVLSFLDRVFYSNNKVFRHKPGAAVAIARRGGTTASFDVLNKYLSITEMPIVSSTYWNIAHGQKPGQVELDGEGMQTMRNIGHNMAWLLRCIEAGRTSGITPDKTERGTWTNFIR